MHLPTILLTGLVAPLVAGHPGHDHAKELGTRLEFLANNKNDLSHCAEKMRTRGIAAANAQRRSQLAENLLKKRGLKGKRT
jgi:sulfur relay (sulfurtransferase) complex TusBCD TusD component (DsrE family)